MFAYFDNRKKGRKSNQIQQFATFVSRIQPKPPFEPTKTCLNRVQHWQALDCRNVHINRSKQTNFDTRKVGDNVGTPGFTQ